MSCTTSCFASQVYNGSLSKHRLDVQFRMMHIRALGPGALRSHIGNPIFSHEWNRLILLLRP